MPRDRDDVVKALTKKGFKKEGGDHEYFIYYNKLGKKTIKKTKVSRGTSHKTIGDNLLSQMARQTGLTKSLFLEFIDCSLDQDKYEKTVFGD